MDSGDTPRRECRSAGLNDRHEALNKLLIVLSELRSATVHVRPVLRLGVSETELLHRG
jgi:hypothetical protein